MARITGTGASWDDLILRGIDQSTKPGPVTKHGYERKLAMVCGDCWYIVRPGDYLPDESSVYDACVICGNITQLNRVTWREVEEAKS